MHMGREFIESKKTSTNKTELNYNLKILQKYFLIFYRITKYIKNNTSIRIFKRKESQIVFMSMEFYNYFFWKWHQN